MNRQQIVTSQRLAGLVERYHTWPTIRRQTNAEHTWQVMRIYCQLFGSPRSEVWFYMLHHDSGEIQTGDAPFPVKKNDEAVRLAMNHLETEALLSMLITLPELTTEEKRRVKVCDLLDMWEFGWEETCRGNGFAAPIIQDTFAALRGMLEVSFPMEWILVQKHTENMRWMSA